MLYVSIWKIALTNLSATAFTKRMLSDLEAATLISQARADASLLAVSSADLVAPYEKRNYDLHVEVCTALRTRGIELVIGDFFNDSFCNPLQFARVSQGHRLLVIDCNFAFNSGEARVSGHPEKPRQAVEEVLEKVSKLFKLNPESFAFHLFEGSSP